MNNSEKLNSCSKHWFIWYGNNPMTYTCHYCRGDVDQSFVDEYYKKEHKVEE